MSTAVHPAPISSFTGEDIFSSLFHSDQNTQKLKRMLKKNNPKNPIKWQYKTYKCLEQSYSVRQQTVTVQNQGRK